MTIVDLLEVTLVKALGFVFVSPLTGQKQPFKPIH